MYLPNKIQGIIPFSRPRAVVPNICRGLVCCLFVVLCLGGPLWQSPAQAIGPEDIQNCDDCQLVDADVNDSGVVTVTDLLIIIRDITDGPPNDPSNDVNGDGNVDMDDFYIARKCLGCELTPSPFT